MAVDDGTRVKIRQRLQSPGGVNAPRLGISTPMSGGGIKPSFSKANSKATTSGAGASGPKTAKQKTAGKPQPVDPASLYSTFEELYNDIMANYGDRVVPGGGIDRAPYDAANAKIAAMYRQLEGSFGGDAEAIKKFFQTAAENYEANAGQARSSIQEAYGASNRERMRQLQALGIEESAAVVGDDTVRDQANALSNVARLLEAAQSRNTGYQESALTLNEQMKGLARMEGAQRQAALQEALSRAAAEASAPRVVSGMSPSQGMSMARARMDEQLRMQKALAPQDEGYGYSDVQSLWDQAALLYPNDSSMQSRWVSSMQRSW